MKKIYLSILVIVISAFSITAQVNRNLVLVEIATGTWCGYCPGAAMGAHDLMTNGDPVAVVEHHSGDSFETTDSDAMINYYGIGSFPTAQFDGKYDDVAGGSATQSMYSSYLPVVTARMAMQTDISVEIYGENTGSNYNVTIRVTDVGSYSGGPLAVRFTLTETDITYSWQNQSTIDYCNRLMVPDSDGTPVSFTSGSVQDVNLTFTFDNTWIDSNCELIAWITDETTKTVQHTESVMLLNLEADAANSNFTADETMPCEGSAVNFTDLSTGAITTWDWTFEGGTPATSTDENPTVTYNTQGVYDVTLYVSDGTTNSTLTIPDMIEVILPPVQPNTPTGETSICANGTYTYTTDAVPYADFYVWEVSPTDAGTITGDGLEGTFVSDGSWTGAYTIAVRADNYCGAGTWSSAFSCNLNVTPAPFLLSEGGGMCEGSAGIEITQDGSETSINYELFKDNVSTGTILPGTGSPLSFGNQTDEGTYTVMGMAPLCDLQMYGTPWLHYLETPGQPIAPDGATAACNTDVTSYSVSSVEYADTIYWDLQPATAGNIISSDFEADIEWNADFSGLATLSAQGANQCGEGPVSDMTEIQVESSPMPVIDGITLICNDESSEYSVDETAGNTYAWTVTGGTITVGTGTNLITVLWGDPGMGYVSVVETSTLDCVGTTDDYEVTIDNCIGIGESLKYGELKIFPNPAISNVEIIFIEDASTKYNVKVYNSVGQLMSETQGITISTKESVNLDISTYQTGLYIVNITSDNGLNIRSTFEKIR